MKFVVALLMMTFMVYCTVAQGINDVQEDGEDLQLETVDLDEEVRRAGFDCNRCGYSVKNRALFCESKDWRKQMDDAVQGMLYSLRTRGTSAGSQRQFLQC